MPDFPVAFSAGRGFSLARAADSMLRALGGGAVTFRVPAAGATAGDTTRQELGIDPAPSEDVRVSPVVVRQSENHFELLLSPKCLEAQLQLRGSTAEEFLDSAVAVCVQGRTLRIRSYQAQTLAGAAYLYRIIAAQ